MFLGYTVGLLYWLCDVVGGLFLPPTNGFIGVLISALFAVAIVVWALWPPLRRRKLAGGGLAVALGVLAVDFYMPLRRMSDALYARTRGADLEAFAAEIRDYRRIRFMTHGHGWDKLLNGTKVAYTEAGRDSVRGWARKGRRPLLATVLERDTIDGYRYREFRRRLREFHFRSFYLHDDYILFQRSRYTGLVVVFETAPPLTVGEQAPDTYVWITRALSERLYYYYY